MREKRGTGQRRREEKRKREERGGTHEKMERRRKVVYTGTVQAHSGTLVDMQSLKKQVLTCRKLFPTGALER